VKTKKLENLKKLSHHIRQYQIFQDYCTLDVALAHRFGGPEWEDEKYMMKAVLYNLNRLGIEKGLQPTEEEVRDYIESHWLDIRYIPGAMEKIFSNLISNLNKKEEMIR